MPPLNEQMIRGKTRLDRLDEVKNLNLWGNELDDCSLLARLTNVEILSLSVNQINTLRDFRGCLKLQELYLRKNEIQDISELQYLAPLKSLKVLWLSDNPCAEHPSYRQLAIRVLPSIEKLDSIEVTEQERQQAYNNPELSKYIVPLDPEAPRPPSRSPARTPPPRSGGGGQQRYPAGYNGDGGGGGGGGQQRKKNILYAVMALLPELDVDDLNYVRREIEQRLEGGELGR